MPSSVKVADIQAALKLRSFPTIMTWNRMEGRPRTPNFDRALKAEVRDALWMLGKQWQMGEFQGSDAGSPVFAKLQVDKTRLTMYQPDGQAPQLFEYNIPLEAKVEHRPIPLLMGGRPMSLDLRLMMGRYRLALIDGVGDYREAFVNAYPITAPDPKKKEDADQCAHPDNGLQLSPDARWMAASCISI
jgi:hypothetical protein